MKKSRYSILFLAAALIMTTGCTAQSLYRVYELPTDGVGGLVKKAAEALEPEGTTLEDVILLSNRNMWDQAIAEGWPLQKPDRSVFRYAMEKGRMDFAYYIIDHGANIQYVDKDGQNELMYLNQWYTPQYPQIVKKLVENGCDVNAVDKNGHNVLEDAVVGHNLSPNAFEKKRVKVLMEVGAALRPEILSILKEQQYVSYSALKELAEGLRKNDVEIEKEDCVDAVILGETERFFQLFTKHEYTDEEKKRIVFYTAAVGTLDQLKQEMSVWSIPADYSDSAGNNLLMAAAAAGNEEVYFGLIGKVSAGETNNTGETLITMALAGENEAILSDMFENSRFDWSYDPSGNAEGDGDRFNRLVDTLSLCENEKYLQLYLTSVDLIDMDWAKGSACYNFIIHQNPYLWDIIMQDTTLSPLAEDKDECIRLLSVCTTPEQVRKYLQFVSPEIRGDMVPALSNILGREGYGIVEDPAQIIREFVLAGVNLKEEDSEAGSHLILSAAEAGDTESVETLIKYGADVNVPLSTGQTALMITARGDRTILRILLENGADVNAADNEGNTALRYAVGFYAEDCVRILLEYGADKSIPLPDGRSLYEYAVEKGNEEIIELLK